MKTINIPKLMKFISEQIKMEEDAMEHLPFENIKPEFTRVCKKNVKNYKKLMSILKMVSDMVNSRVDDPKNPMNTLAILDEHVGNSPKE